MYSMLCNDMNSEYNWEWESKPLSRVVLFSFFPLKIVGHVIRCFISVADFSVARNKPSF